MFLWTHESSYKNYAFFGIFFILLIGFTNQYQKEITKEKPFNVFLFTYHLWVVITANYYNHVDWLLIFQFSFKCHWP